MRDDKEADSYDFELIMKTLEQIKIIGERRNLKLVWSNGEKVNHDQPN